MHRITEDISSTRFLHNGQNRGSLDPSDLRLL